MNTNWLLTIVGAVFLLGSIPTYLISGSNTNAAFAAGIGGWVLVIGLWAIVCETNEANRG